MTKKHTPQDSDDKDFHPLEKLRQTFKADVEALRKLELKEEELAKQKADVLKKHIKDDVHGVKSFWEDLKVETTMLEEFAADWLLKAADPTPLDWLKLDQHIDKGEDRLMAGEIATDVELACVACGTVRLVEGTVTLTPCSRCDCELFQIRRELQS